MAVAREPARAAPERTNLAFIERFPSMTHCKVARNRKGLSPRDPSGLACPYTGRSMGPLHDRKKTIGRPAAFCPRLAQGGALGPLGARRRRAPSIRRKMQAYGAARGRDPMRLSRYFLPILRETPKEAEIVSHRLMLRAGMIRQESAGSYAWLPLGVRVLHKICAIVREEQDRAGAIEVLMPTVQPADLWRESGRYDDYGKEMLRIRDRHERDMLYGPTNEEMMTEIFRASVRSYKDLPLNLYHIQWKFRDEVRPRFGVMRSREFLMK